MRFRVAWLTVLCAGSLFANVEFAAAQAASDEAAQPLRLVIRAEKASYQANEVPTTQYNTSSRVAVFAVTGEIQNISQQGQLFYDVYSSGNPTYHLIGPRGKPMEIAYLIVDPPLPQERDFVLVKTGKSLPKTLECRFWTGDAVATGIYTLSITYRVAEKSYLAFDGKKVTLVDLNNAWTGTLRSNEVKIEVR